MIIMKQNLVQKQQNKLNVAILRNISLYVALINFCITKIVMLLVSITTLQMKFQSSDSSLKNNCKQYRVASKAKRQNKTQKTSRVFCLEDTESHSVTQAVVQWHYHSSVASNS